MKLGFWKGWGKPLSVLVGATGGRGDTIAPTVTITSTESSPSFINPIPLTFTLSEPSTNFVVGDITVGAGASIGNFVGAGTSYTADLTVTTAGATVTVDVAGGAFTDAAGNSNVAATQFSITSGIILLDKFLDTRAAGAVNGTAPTPGPGGNRVISEAGASDVSCGSGYLMFASASDNDGAGWTTQTRTLGRVFMLRIKNHSISVGLSTTNTGKNIAIGFNETSSGVIRNAATPFQNYDGVDNSLTTFVYNYIIVIKPTGAWLFVQGGKYPYPTLVYYNRVEATATLYTGFNRSGAGAPQAGAVKIADSYTPTALCSDSFTRADGAVGGIWTEVAGTGAVSSNALVITPSGGVGILTTPATKADTFVVAKATRSTGTVGVVTHYVDTSNYVRIIHDGTNLKIVQRLAGAESDLASAAITYSAGADISCETVGASIRAWYNNTHIASSPAAMNAALAASTTVGVWSSDAGNTLDDFEVYARGSANEHSSLSTIVEKGTRGVFCDGDSLTQGGNPGTPYPTQLAALYTPALEINNYGVSGQTIAQMITNSPAKLDGHATYWTTAVLCVLGGSNDLAASVAAATVYSNIVSYCQSRRSAGYKVIVMTILPRTGIAGGNETSRGTVNTNIRNNWATFADGIADIAAATELDDFTDTTYFHTDQTHLTTAGYGVVASLVKTAIDGL